MLISFFFSFSLSNSQFSLFPPFRCANGTEIGNWTLRNNANPSKHSIRLTSHISSNSGSICQLAPNYARDWELISEITADGGNGGNGFMFFYTQELCTEQLFGYHGLAFWLNTSGTERRPAPFYFLNRTVSPYPILNNPPKCSIDYYTGNPIFIKITKQLDKIKVESKNPTKDEKWVPCFEETVQDMIKVGYFSVAATTNEKYWDDHELYSLNITLLSKNEEPANISDQISTNRKLLDKHYLSRKQRKQNRRALLPTVEELFNETKLKNNKLDGKDVDIAAAYEEISEIIFRLKSSLTTEQISNKLGPMLKKKVDYMMNLTETAILVREAKKTDVITLWNDTMNNLTEIAQSIKKDLESTKEEAIQFTKEVITTKENKKVLKRKIGLPVEMESNRSELILGGIALIELTAYILFFIYQRFISDKLKKLS